MSRWPKPQGEHDERCLSDIREHGWHVAKVPAVGDTPAWCFTIGLHRNYGHPEVITFGLPLNTGHAVLNIAGRGAKAGSRFNCDAPYDDFLDGYDCMFRSVEAKWHRWFAGYAMWFYGGSDFPLLQLFWPDREHTFPWDPSAENWLQSSQPLLYETDATRAHAAALLALMRETNG